MPWTKNGSSTNNIVSNSLKTENSLTVLPRLLSVFRTECVEDPVPKIANPVCKNAKKAGQKSVNVSMLKAGHNTVSHHRLSLLFPKLRLSNFMISSLASLSFCAVPQIRSTQLSLPPDPAAATTAATNARRAALPAQAKVYYPVILLLKSSISNGPGASLSTTSHVFEADKLLSIMTMPSSLIFFISKLKKCSNSFFISLRKYQKVRIFDYTAMGQNTIV